MSKIVLLERIIIVLLLILIVAIGIGFSSSQKENKQTIDRLEKKVKTLSEGETSVKKEYRQLWDDYEKLYTEKNGTANESLLTSTNELFSKVFSYRSEKEEDSIEKRKQESVQYATNQALNGLFPKNATDSVASVSTVSKMDKEPEVYIMSSDNKEIRALVVISYSVSIAGSEAQKGTFMYKVTFEPQQGKFTHIKNLGEVNLI